MSIIHRLSNLDRGNPSYRQLEGGESVQRIPWVFYCGACCEAIVVVIGSGPNARWLGSRFLRWQPARTIGHVAGGYATIGHDGTERCLMNDPESNPAAFLGAELRRARVAAGFSS